MTQEQVMDSFDATLENEFSSTLFYAHDPMCSWCWAFNPIWKKLKAGLPSDVVTCIVLGGLAPDSDQPMPASMQEMLQSTWRRIADVVPGTQFNHDFWHQCQPRRSTYPACRAVLAARAQNSSLEEPMIEAIQQAYYLQAKNPSDTDVLVSLAESIGCDSATFAAQLQSDAINKVLHENIAFAQQLGAGGFPSLILRTNKNELRHISIDYSSAISLLDQISNTLAA